MKLAHMLVVGFTFAAMSQVTADDKKAEKVDPAKLVGTYSFTAGVKDGEKAPADNLKGLSMTFTKDTMTMKTPDGEFKFKYSVDASKTPADLEMEITDGPIGKGSKAKGIISMEGGTVKLAYHPMGGERPKDFECKKGSGQHCFVLKKAEPKKDK
jgi:uncharacterized protein (TIGR03067 family)